MNGLYAHKLPERDVEGEVTQAWIAVDRLTTAPQGKLWLHQRALLEIRDKINFMLGDGK